MSTALIAALERHFGHTTLSRGRTYAKTGQVTSWQVEPDQKTMTAVVRGSKTYRQQIHFAWSASGALTHVYGQCSCPMGYNCKHVAAAILVAQAAGALPDSVGHNLSLEHAASAPQNQAYAGTVNNAQSSRPAPPMDNAIRAWLTQAPKQLAHTPVTVDPNEYPATVKDRIRYVVQQSRGRVNITPMKVTLRKDGSTSANSRARQYEFRHVRDETRARFVLPIDVRIFRLLSLSERDYGMYRPTVPDNEEGQTLFRLVLETGRAYWEQTDGQLLHLGKPRHGQFVWRHCGEAQQLMIKAEAEHDAEHADQRDATEQWLKALPITPPWYMDPETGACGLLETEHTIEEIRWLASAPPVPAAQADQVLAAMSQANIKLPRPNPVAQQLITDIEPTPVLTLGAIKAREERYDLFRHYKLPYQKHEIAPMLRLSFDYDGHRIALDAPDTITHHAADGQLQLIARDQISETKHLETLMDYANGLGFHPVDFYTDDADMAEFEQSDLVLWPFNGENPLSEMGGGHEALDFIEDVAPILRDEGWQVIIDTSWPCRIYKGSSNIRGGITEQEDSWFSIGLHYEVDGQEFDLLPVLAKLVESIPEEVLHDETALQNLLDDRPFVARLKDGQYARLPLEKLIPALRFIRDLHEQLHAAQAGAVRELVDALAGCGIPFTGGERLLALGSRLRQLLASNSASKTQPVIPETFHGHLRPYQTTGMAWMLALSDTGFGGILADDMGLGKTVQTLAFLATKRDQPQKSQQQSPQTTEQSQLPCLLVVPTSLVSNWVREAAQFVPDMKVLALQGLDRKNYFDQIERHDLVITTYPLLHRDSETLFAHEYDTVILDEAQYVKNPTSQVAKLIRQIPAKHRMALTGTPMENNLEELWCLFDWLIPGLLGSRKLFGEKFRKPIEKENNLARQVALSKRISPFVMRRTKDQVVTDLPPRTEIVESVELTGAQRALYETVRATMHERVRKALAQKGLASSKITVLDALLKLRQACCDPQLVKLASAAKITTSAKRSRLMEILEELFAEGRRVLVFSQFVEMLNLIEVDVKARGWDYLKLTGQTQKRGELVNAFQSGDAPLFLISLKAGGVGLNLTAADTVILYDPWWNPAIERQAMDRVHRIGQDKPVFVHRLIAHGTVETKISQMQARKQALMDSVFDPDSGNNMDMSEEEIMSLFAPIE
ncbi:MAG: DEAD/DEAH box helicase [Burkholderiaceae bacterium]|nr:DEAD/DEAH box helicase [Burkholderiaceae bacterium]